MGKARDLARLSPDSSGKILLASGVTGVLPDANAPSGSVIQVVQTSASTEIITSSVGTWVATGLSQAITPVSVNSKILCLVHCPIRMGSSNNITASIRIKRNSTEIVRDKFMNNVSSVTDISYPVDLSYLDSPSTISSITYSVDFQVSGSASSYTNPRVCWDNANTPINLILMEIAG